MKQSGIVTGTIHHKLAEPILSEMPFSGQPEHALLRTDEATDHQVLDNPQLPHYLWLDSDFCNHIWLNIPYAHLALRDSAQVGRAPFCIIVI